MSGRAMSSYLKKVNRTTVTPELLGDALTLHGALARDEPPLASR